MNPNNIDESRVQHASKYLDGSDYIVHKGTRAGFTTSFAIAAGRSSKKVLALAPTTRIISETIDAACDDNVRIYGNSACKYNREEIKKFPLLAHLPMVIPKNCGKCKHADGCCILDIKRNPGAQMKSMTLAKFEAVMTSDSGLSVE